MMGLFVLLFRVACAGRSVNIYVGSERGLIDC